MDCRLAARTDRRLDPIQRSAAGRAAHVAGIVVATAEGTRSRQGDQPDAVADRARGLRVPIDYGGPRTRTVGPGLRHLGPALGRQRAVLAASRRAASDVGHAAQPQSDPDAEAAQRRPVPVSGAAGRPAFMVAADRPERRYRSVLAGPRLWCR